VSVHNEADGRVSPAVGDENCRLIAVFSDDTQDRVSLGVQGPTRTLRIVRVKAGQRHRQSMEVVVIQVFKNVIPRPGAKPVASDENDGRTARSGCHATTFAGPADNAMSLFMS